jgi:hypothetical protein
VSGLSVAKLQDTTWCLEVYSLAKMVQGQTASQKQFDDAQFAVLPRTCLFFVNIVWETHLVCQ